MHCPRSNKLPKLIVPALLLAFCAFEPLPDVLAQTRMSLPAGENFFSVPYTFSGESLATIFGYSPVTLEVYSTTGFDYITTPTPPANQINLGVAYWANFPNAINISGGTAGSQTQDFSISLLPGWNTFGDPFTSPVALSSALFNGETYAQAVLPNGSSTPLVNGPLYSYSGGAYVEGYTLTPGVGYQFYSYSLSSLTMLLPAPGNQATHLGITTPAIAVPGTPLVMTVQALDSNNALVVSYTGTVTFSSSDGAAALPPNTVLSGGMATVSAAMVTPGSQTVTATVTTQPSYTASSTVYVDTMALSSVPACR